jgi:hypothetical protein
MAKKKVIEAKEAALAARPTLASQCSAIRKILPWAGIEKGARCKARYQKEIKPSGALLRRAYAETGFQSPRSTSTRPVESGCSIAQGH